MQLLDRKLKSMAKSVYCLDMFFWCFISTEKECFLGICFSHDCEKEQLDIIPTTDFAEVIFPEKKRVK